MTILVEQFYLFLACPYKEEEKVGVFPELNLNLNLSVWVRSSIQTLCNISCVLMTWDSENNEKKMWRWCCSFPTSCQDLVWLHSKTKITTSRSEKNPSGEWQKIISTCWVAKKHFSCFLEFKSSRGGRSK